MKSLLFLTILTIFYNNSWLVTSLCTEDSENPDDVFGDAELHRSKRDNEDVTGPENPLWGNPCHYSNWTRPQFVPSSIAQIQIYGQIMAAMTVKAYTDLKDLEQRMAVAVWGKSNIEEVFKPYENVQWLQNSTAYKWFREEVLPSEKKIHTEISHSYLVDHMNKTQFEKAAPRILKGYKIVLAALRELAEAGVCWDAISIDAKLRGDLDVAVRTVKRGLCYFTDYIQAAQLWNLHLDNSEFFYTGKDVMKLWYRDSLNFLQYVGQVMSYRFEI